MKRTSWIAASVVLSVVLSVGALAERAGSRLRTIDDPPPEPITCPLCGGDPAMHALRVFAFTDLATRATALALRW
jgi:hypothetical protein